MMSLLFELGASLFDSVLGVYFMTKYNKYKKKSFWPILAILIFFGVTLIGDYCAENFSWLITFSLISLSIGYSLIISEKKYFSAICSACIFHITLILLSTLLFHFYTAIFGNFEELLFGVNGAGRYAYIITHKILLLALLRLILLLKEHTSYGSLLNGILTIVFSVVTMFGLYFTIDITGVIDTSPINTQLLLITFIFLLLNVLLYVLLSQISHLHKKNYDLALLSEKAEFENKKYQESLRLWNESEKKRHDIKHHMAVLSGLLEAGETDKCQAYINDYLTSLQSEKKFSPSGSAVIDYLIHSKLAPLQETEIIVVGNVGDLSDIADIDLASLIGNILDNAIEAEEKVQHKRIELLFQQQNNNRMIICKNNIEASVLETNRELRSTKKARYRHGYGHQIVADIVLKYNGLVDYFEENGMFGVQILLPK